MGRTVSRARTILRRQAEYLSGGKARLRLALGRPVRFSGAFESRAAALDSLSAAARVAYDRADIADVSLDAMVKLAPWDYPVLFWLDRLRQTAAEPMSVLDAGGHVGTKFIAFSNHLDMREFDWSIWDLPALLQAGRNGQAAGTVPNTITFVDRPADAGTVDILLGSGLMQYIDITLSDLVRRLTALPPYILLNKVAVRPGPDLHTIEQIGPGRVPYRIRNHAAFEDEIEALGYEIADHWQIPDLGHRIATHPWLGRSASVGYMLTRR